MIQYPLKFKVSSKITLTDLTVLDAAKNKVFYRPEISDAVKQGSQTCAISAQKEAPQPLFYILGQPDGDLQNYLVQTPSKVFLAKIVANSAHSWNLLDAGENLLATIQEKFTVRDSCLYALLTFPMDQTLVDTIFKIFFPHQIVVSKNGIPVLKLTEGNSTINDDHTLKKQAELAEGEESLMLAALITLFNKNF